MNYKKLSLLLMAGIFLSAERKANAQIDSVVFNFTDSVQRWTVPACIDSIRVSAFGAQGGAMDTVSSPVVGGLGAEMNGTFTVTPGDILKVMVGRIGYSSGAFSSGGGGGSGVVKGAVPLIIAAGGGGRFSGGYALSAGDTATSGEPGIGGSNAPGGVGGNKGDSVSYGSLSIAYGGNGFNQGDSGSKGMNGYTTYPTTTSNGSWGLGGGGGGVGGSYCSCGGGGGGYSGGGAGGINGDGGGGGSYNAGTNKIDFPGVQSGNGKVVIFWNPSISPLKDTAKIIMNVTCNGDSNGIATASVSGGSKPFTYSWMPSGGSKDTATGLKAGSYTVSVKDACGDSAKSIIAITQPSAIMLTDSTKSDTGNCKGWAKVKASGGTGIYTYSWTGGGTMDTISNRCSGSFTCTVTDSNGCSKAIAVKILSTAGLPTIAGKGNISIYPNPNTGSFTISGAEKGDVVEIYNSLGQMVETKSAEGSTTQFNITGKANGIYLLKILTQNGTLVGEQQLLKQQ